MKAPEYKTDNWLEFLRKTDNELLRLSRMDVFKATGKGGQKKNKTSNAIRLTLSHLSVTESQSRSKTENIKGALKKLRLAIALDTKDVDSIRTSLKIIPSEIESYLNTSEIGINANNPLFPIFVGLFINCYVRNSGDWKAIGKDLGFTPSQVRKFIEKHPKLYRSFKEVKISRVITAASV